MNKKYEEVTSFVSLKELENDSAEQVVGGLTAMLCATVTLTVIVVSEAACPSKACTGHCNE